MSDRRPIHSPMPPHLAAIVDDVGPLMTALLRDTSRRVHAAGAADRDRAGVANDALSMQSQLLAIGVACFVATLADAKQVTLSAVRQPAIEDILRRAHALLDGIEAITAVRGGATKQ